MDSQRIESTLQDSTDRISEPDISVSEDENYDGGSNARIAGSYLFDSFSDFQAFYDIFKKHNKERYWTPISDSEDFTVTYKFKSEGMYLKDYVANRYDLTFGYQSMYTFISDKDFEAEITLSDMEEYSFDKELSADNLSYQQKWHGFLIYSNETLVGKGEITKGTIDEEKAKDILSLFKEGSNYVF